MAQALIKEIHVSEYTNVLYINKELLMCVSMLRKYQDTAYCQLTQWCWGWLGRTVRVTLLACAVSKIRSVFPSEHYMGFQLPDL